jgi:UPF0176 protein
MKQIDIFSFYQFHPIQAENLEQMSSAMDTEAKRLDVRGLIIFGTEGINATISGEHANLVSYCEFIVELLQCPKFLCKESLADFHPFRKFKVKLRTEIVTLGKPEVLPEPHTQTHLSPEDWKKTLESGEDYVLLDTRNTYETKIGKFKNATDPQIEEFQEFPEFLQKSGIAKDKKVLIYCTGGIRCEKAIVEMHNQGFENVYQLEGGILNYIAQYPNQEFEGECFVFDHRVAVDQELKPTQNFKMCPHCGQPADLKIICRRCDLDAVICPECSQKESLQTCSKNCAHHYEVGQNLRGKPQMLGYRYQVARRS